uniref:NADH-ubiquinone oxidoreductase chain 5 n=1 Tax=Euthalenessa festiva TaxID=2153328 RepID=A0A343W6K1_9ANNE|nr:NADH dehydrogenase subunit 5 [Euthalenessa festiva]
MSLFSHNASKLLWLLFPWPLFTALFLFLKEKTIFISWFIFESLSSDLAIPLILDPTGCLFSATVLFISANVMQFAASYMKGDPFLQRFSHIVLLFVLSMNLLIFIPHLICLLIGWDGLGIVSFILVIYYQNPKSLAAGMITALMNRVGDVMILLSIAIMLNLGHWNILSLWTSPSSIFLSLMIMVAAMTKSAQIPFSSWLPAAMAAPTPVSALVHSSTLVTAGVFLLIRFHYFLSLHPAFNSILLIIATMTMFMAGTAAIAECDMKKIIALSTLSQLGVMMSSLGLGLTTLAFFHLITHALFKALLFLTAGSMIHFHHHSQDLRFMGNLSSSSPLSISCLSIANLALCGSPFLAGFYSKDLILEMSLFSPYNLAIILMFFLATGMTASYSIRFMITTLWINSSSLPSQYVSDSDHVMTTPMMLLTFGAIMAGASLSWIAFSNLDEPYLPMHLKTLALVVTIIGAYSSWTLVTNKTSSFQAIPLMNFFFASMWFLTPSMSQSIMNFPLSLAHKLLKLMDHGWLESLGSQGMFSSISSSSTYLTSNQMNPITTHLSLLTIFIIPIIIF